MKKILFLLLVFLLSVFCIFLLFRDAQGFYLHLKSGYVSIPTILSIVYYISSDVILWAIAIKGIVKSNLDHAARLTYEEYKERAKQKKLEKTRKKMQELEEKLQKESTE